MSIDGRTVRRALSSRLRPQLEQNGFDRFDVRDSWRRNALTIDLISFRFVSAYDAPIHGATTLSFRCEVGVYYPIAAEEEVDWPATHHLTFQALLGKSIVQPYFRESAVGVDRAETWYVFADGSNLDLVVEDAAQSVVTQAIPYLDRLDDPNNAIEELQFGPGTRPGLGRLGVVAGGLGSPFRQRAMDRIATLIP